tara:strand:+ start:3023 stop:3655 length:633 start_codon:yes stop_codon:yes gene_type:complete
MAYPFDEHHLPQRGILPLTPSSERVWMVDLASAKEHLRIGHNDDDTYITRLCKAAQLVCENYCGSSFSVMEWNFTCDTWEQTMEIPEVSGIRLITSIQYMDNADPSVQQTWAASNYLLENISQRSRIILVDGKSYPSLRNGVGNIKILLVGQPVWNVAFTTDLNEVAFQAVLITIADMYENRQSVVVGRIASKIPKTAQYLLDTLRIQTL